MVDDILRRRVRRRLNLDPIRATIGTAEGAIYIPGQPGMVWARIRTAEGNFLPPCAVRAGATVNMRPGSPVLLRYDEDNQLAIDKADFSSQVSAGVNPITTNPLDPYAHGVTNQTEILTLLSHPTTPGTLQAYMKAWPFIVNGTLKIFPGGLTPMLSGSIPVTGSLRGVLFTVKSDLDIGAYFSTIKGGADPLDQDDYQEMLNYAYAEDASNTPGWVYRLEGGQTELTDADRWLDLRQLINYSGQSGGSGSGSGSGTVTNVSATATPTSVFDINVTDPTTTPAIALTMDNQNEKTFLAGPTSGAAAQPAFRAIASDDLAVALATPPNIGGTTPAAGTFGVFQATSVRLAAPNTAALSSDAFSWSQSYTIVAAETGTADNLATISNGAQGRILTIQADAGDTITVKHNTGNIVLSTGVDYTLSGNTMLMLVYDGAKWVDVTLNGLQILTTKGDLLTRSSSAIARLAVGADYLALFADSTATNGIAYIHPLSLPIRNGSGATANAGDAGYIDYDATYGQVYKRTNTANFVAARPCAVVVGGADGSEIKIITRGSKVTLNYAGSAPSAGQLLAFSTTNGQVAARTLMHPGVMGQALAAGSGGTVSAILLCETASIVLGDSNDIFAAALISDSLFTGTINGSPTTTSVVVTTATGAIANFKPVLTTHLFKPLLWNTTDGTSRRVTNCSGSTVTTEATTDGWANTEALTIESQTVVAGLPYKYVDLERSNYDVVPKLARAIVVNLSVNDTSTTTAALAYMHPFSAYVTSKINAESSIPVGSTYNIKGAPAIDLIDEKFAWAVDATGSNTASIYIRLAEIRVAVP